MAVGLAGFDLTDFYTSCAIASGQCTASSYNAYDGYALVSYIFDASANTAGVFGACFNDGSDTTCWTADSSSTTYTFNTLSLSANASASNPTSMTTDAYTTTDCTVQTPGGFNSVCFTFN